MKYTQLLIAALIVTFAARGQEKKEWATISVPQLKCWTCKERLDSYLAREKGGNNDAGLLQWKVAMGPGTLRIQYIPTRISLDYIRTAINNAGFDADSTKATEESYRKLPPICKRAVDGGGPQKGKPCHMEPLP